MLEDLFKVILSTFAFTTQVRVERREFEEIRAGMKRDCQVALTRYHNIRHLRMLNLDKADIDGFSTEEDAVAAFKEIDVLREKQTLLAASLNDVCANND